MKQSVIIEVDWVEVYKDSPEQWPEDGIDTYLAYDNQIEMVPGYVSVRDYLDNFVFIDDSVHRVFCYQVNIANQLPLPTCSQG